MTFVQRILSVFLAEWQWFRRRVGGTWFQVRLAVKADAMWLHEDQLEVSHIECHQPGCDHGAVISTERYRSMYVVR